MTLIFTIDLVWGEKKPCNVLQFHLINCNPWAPVFHKHMLLGFAYDQRLSYWELPVWVFRNAHFAHCFGLKQIILFSITIHLVFPHHAILKMLLSIFSRTLDEFPCIDIGYIIWDSYPGFSIEFEINFCVCIYICSVFSMEVEVTNCWKNKDFEINSKFFNISLPSFPIR